MKEQSKPNLIQMNFVLWICHSKNVSLVTGSAADYYTNNDDSTSLMGVGLNRWITMNNTK